MLQVGKPVKGIDFIGREKELSLLVNYLKMGQSVVIIAPRRFGKTSLVFEALSQLKNQNFYTAFVDIFANPGIDLLASSITTEVLKNHKLDKIFTETKNSASSMLKNIGLKSVLDDFQFIIGFSENNSNQWELLLESIDFVDNFTKKHNSKIVCALDEFGDIRKFDTSDNLIKVFRSKIQQQTTATYIFSGSYESVMQNMFVDSKSPFYRMVKIIRLGYLDHEVLFAHLNSKLNVLKINYPESDLRTVIEVLRGHPYYCQLAFQQIVLFNALNSRIPSNQELFSVLFVSEKDYLEKVWEDISGNREFVYVISAVANDGKNLYSRLKSKNINIARAAKKLEGMGMLFRNEQNNYYLSDPMMELWLKTNISTAIPE